MLALWQVSISSLHCQTCPNRLNTRPADRPTGINIYTDTHRRVHIDTLWHTNILYVHTQILTLHAETVSWQLPTNMWRRLGYFYNREQTIMLWVVWEILCWVCMNVFLSMQENDRDISVRLLMLNTTMYCMTIQWTSSLWDTTQLLPQLFFP